MVFDIAPEMNGCAAAIIFTWAGQAIDLVPFEPHGVAQSNTARCSSFSPGAPSIVRLPKMCSPAASTSSWVKPRKPSVSKNASSYCSSVMPREPVQSSFPSSDGAKADRMSKTSPILLSISVRSLALNPASIKRSTGRLGHPAIFPVPIMYSSIVLHSLSEYPNRRRALGTPLLTILREPPPARVLNCTREN